MTVSIIALLISVLIPSLQNARAGARSAKCLSNLRTLATNCAIYAVEDHHENVVPVHPRIVGWRDWGGQFQASGIAEWGGRSGVGGPYNDSTDPVVTSYWGTANGLGPGSRPLNQVIYKSAPGDHVNEPGVDQLNWRNDAELDFGIYHCPSDSGYTGYYHPLWKESGLAAYEHFGNSYQVPPLQGGWGAWCTRSIGAFLHGASGIPNPGDTLLIGDACGAFAPLVGYTAHGVCEGSTTPNPWATYVALSTVSQGWHGRDWVFNFAYADSHAVATRVFEVDSPAPQLSRYPLSRITGKPTAYEDWQCQIVRGPGWQLDALPAIPVAWGLQDTGPGACN